MSCPYPLDNGSVLDALWPFKITPGTENYWMISRNDLKSIFLKWSPSFTDEQVSEGRTALPVRENMAVCPECDLLQQIPGLPPGGKARCARCNCTMASYKPDSLYRTMALTVAAAIVWVIANTTSLMELSAAGRKSDTTILGGALEMWSSNQEITAALVAFCAVIAPAVYIGFMLIILLAVRQPQAPPWVGVLLRISEFNKYWAMVEVMMLGILIALIKISDLALVITGTGMYAIAALALLIVAMTANFDAREIWMRIRWVGEHSPPLALTEESAHPGRATP